MAAVDAAIFGLKCLTGKLTEYKQYYLDVVLTSLRAVLLSISKLEQCSQDENQKIKEVIEKAAKVLLEWVIHKQVIGGSVFGGSVKNGKPEKELEVSVLCMVISCVMKALKCKPSA